MEASKCAQCGKVFFPERMVCSSCGSKKLSKVQLSKRGKLLTFTVIRYPPTGYESQAPYVVGLVELPEGVRVLSRITDCRPEQVKIGMEVEATVRRVTSIEPDGLIMYGYKFRPMDSELGKK